MMQSHDTKNENLEKDLEDILNNIKKRQGGTNRPDQDISGCKTRMMINSRHCPEFQPRWKA